MRPTIKLLIVDDESRFLHAIAARLRLRGFEVITACSGAEALELADRHTFHVALVDLKMPGLDGGQVLQALKQRQPFVEAIILTGHGVLESAVEMSKVGAFACLPKPYELDLLLLTLKQAYVVRLKRRFAAHPEIVERVDAIACDDNVIDVLARLRELEDGAAGS
jgi:DNA-binding NtrC family response regulator